MNDKMKIKVLAHITAIIFFLIGCVMLHVLVNNPSDVLLFFEILVSRCTVLDTSLILLGIGFFLEFYMSFKPMEVK